MSNALDQSSTPSAVGVMKEREPRSTPPRFATAPSFLKEGATGGVPVTSFLLATLVSILGVCQVADLARRRGKIINVRDRKLIGIRRDIYQSWE